MPIQKELAKEKEAGIDLFYQVREDQVSSTQKSLTAVFGKGTGGTSTL